MKTEKTVQNGVINVYKERGYTSHDVVARLRGILKQKKIGHTGTLDPEAEGVLPVCLGNATRLCGMLTDQDKEYRAELLLGVTTDTQDMTGQVLARKEVCVTGEETQKAVMGFLGTYEQLPPMYSACKVDGKRLYELAREGKEVERRKRPVTIHELEICSIELPRVRLRVVCSKGTYIRTLCHDIGERLGCGGTMAGLVRTRVDRFTLDQAKRLDEIEDAVKAGEAGSLILPVEEMFSALPVIRVKEGDTSAVRNGNPLFLRQITGKSGWLDKEQVRIHDSQGRFYGIYEFQVMKGRFVPVKMFLPSASEVSRE